MDFARERRQVQRLTKEGLEKFAANDYESALRAFERVLIFDDDNPLANTLGAASLLNLGRIEEAEPLARRGLGLTPHIALAHYCLGATLIAKGCYEEAESEILEAVALDPSNNDMRLALGGLLLIRERHEEASEQLARSVELSPDSAEAHFLLGLCLMRRGQFEEAREELETTQQLQPENDQALTFDGLLCIARADDLLTTPPKLAGFRHAANLLRRALELNPSNELATEYLAIVDETIQRISRPTDMSPPRAAWYKDLFKLLLLWVGLAALAIGLFALIAWVDSSFGIENFYVGMLAILVIDIVAFFIMLYRRKDYSALPPTIIGFLKRISDRDLSPTVGQAESRS